MNRRFKVKDWRKFQHYKRRRPPWIKLYDDLLSDPEWHSLSGDEAKFLVMCWLAAADDPERDGNLPAVRDLAFMLRISTTDALAHLIQLKHWIVESYQQGASDVLAPCLQDATPETETETETETEKTGKTALHDEAADEDTPDAVSDFKRLLVSFRKAFPKFNVDQFVNKNRIDGKFAPAELLSLVFRSMLDFGGEIKNPWIYAQTIFDREKGNFYEQRFQGTVEKFEHDLENTAGILRHIMKGPKK